MEGETPPSNNPCFGHFGPIFAHAWEFFSFYILQLPTIMQKNQQKVMNGHQGKLQTDRQIEKQVIL